MSESDCPHGQRPRACETCALEAEVHRLQVRLDWIMRGLKAANEDRRFAWGELKRENEICVEERKGRHRAETERDLLRDVVAVVESFIGADTRLKTDELRHGGVASDLFRNAYDDARDRLLVALEDLDSALEKLDADTEAEEP